MDAMLWDKTRTSSVRATKIRSFTIYPERVTLSEPIRYKLLGWYNSNDNFYFGSWDTEEEARQYLENLHAQIERR